MNFYSLGHISTTCFKSYAFDIKCVKFVVIKYKCGINAYIYKLIGGILIPSVELSLISNLFSSSIYSCYLYHSCTNLGLSVPGKNLELTFSHFLPPSLWASQVLLRKDCSLSPWLYDSFSSFRTGCAVTGKVLIFYHAYICLVDESENRKVIKGKAFSRKWPRKIRGESLFATATIRYEIDT